MVRKKSMMKTTAAAVGHAAQAVADGLKIAGEAVVDAIAPKPIRAGDKLILPSGDPSVPPVVVPVKKRARRTGSQTPRAARAPASKRRTARGGASRKAAAKRTTRKSARRASRR